MFFLHSLLEVCIVFYLGKWYRAFCVKTNENSNQLFTMQFFDFGCLTKIVQSSHIYPIPVCLAKIICISKSAEAVLCVENWNPFTVPLNPENYFAVNSRHIVQKLRHQHFPLENQQKIGKVHFNLPNYKYLPDIGNLREGGLMDFVSLKNTFEKKRKRCNSLYKKVLDRQFNLDKKKFISKIKLEVVYIWPSSLLEC